MPLDQSFVGRVYPPTAPYRVSREKIREFASAVGDPNPASTDPDAALRLGHPDVVAPPTFPTVVTMPAGRQVLDDPALGLDYSRVVHGEQRFVYSRPLHAGDVVTVVVSVEEIRSAAGNDLIRTRADLATDDGTHLCSAYSTLVVRGTAP